MAVARLLIVSMLAAVLASSLGAPLQADGGVDAAGQVFLRFQFGVQPRDAGPRFGLRLGALPEPEPGDARAPDFTEDFTSALDLSFDGEGQGGLSLAGVTTLGIGGADPTGPDAAQAVHDGVGVVTEGPGGRIAPRRLETPPLVTAAGPEETLRPARWTFHAVQPPVQVIGPRFRRLAATMLERRHGVTAPPAFPVRTAAADAAPRWRFRAVKADAAPPADSPAADSPAEAAIAGYAALLLGPQSPDSPHAAAPSRSAGAAPGQLSGQAAAAAPAPASRLSVGQWIFHDLSGAAAG